MTAEKERQKLVEEWLASDQDIHSPLAERILEAHASIAGYWARRYAGANDALYDDYRQVALLALWRALGRKDQGKKASFETFAHAVCRNAIRSQRSRGLRIKMISLDSGPAFDTSDPETARHKILNGFYPLILPADKLIDRIDAPHSLLSREFLMSAQSPLPEEYKSVVNAVWFDEMEYAEAAEELEIKIGTVKSRLHRARKALTNYIAIRNNGGNNELCLMNAN